MAIKAKVFGKPRANFGSGFGEWLKTFTACFCAVALAVSLQAKADPPAGNGSPGVTITSPNATENVGGTSFAATLDVNSVLPQVQTFGTGTNASCTTDASLAASFVGGCTTANTGATNLAGFALAPQQTTWACASTCTVGDSQHLYLCRSLAAGPDCAGQIYFTSGGSLILTTSGSVSTNSHNLSAGNGTFTASKVLSNNSCSGTSPFTAASDAIKCQITSVSSSATWTFATAYATAPACHAQDQTTATALKVVTTTTNVVVTGQAGASDVVIIGCEN